MRYVCPQNKKARATCKMCNEANVVHVKEEWVPQGAPIPKCTLHDVALVVNNI